MRLEFLGTIAAAILLSANGLAQAPAPRVQPQIIQSTAGEDLYKFYCSNCHGLDGKGKPASPGMRKAAPDLTRLAAANGGVFPRARVEAVIRHGGTATPSHGLSDMPVWGTIFRALEPNEQLVEIRIENLVQYLESLQSPGKKRSAD